MDTKIVIFRAGGRVQHVRHGRDDIAAHDGDPLQHHLHPVANVT
jgi:hypothetical protein